MDNNRNTLLAMVIISVLIMALLYRTNSNALEEQENAPQEEVVKNNAEDNLEETEKLIEANTETYSDSILVDSTNLLDSEELEAKKEFGAFYKSADGELETVRLENELLKLDISNKGGQIAFAELKSFLTYEKQPLILINESQGLSFEFPTTTNNYIRTENLFFDIVKSGNSVICKANIDSETGIVYTYTLKENSYLLDFDVKFTNPKNFIPTNSTTLPAIWTYNALPQEQNADREKQRSTIYWKEKGGDVEHLGMGKTTEEEVKTKIDWIAFKQQFFNTTLFVENGAMESDVDIASIVETEDSTIVANFSSDIIFTFAPSQPEVSLEMQYYLGPNDYKLLKKEIGRETHEIIDLSVDFILFRWVKYISTLIIIPLFNFLEKFFSNYGIIILLMTLLIKMALMPLTFKSYVSSAKQRLLKPELDELKKKFGDDQTKYSAAQMELYRKTGVSMFGGCLPTLLQMPILLAMFYFFPSSIELRQESFLWAQDLSTYDSILNLPFNIPLYGSHVSLFTLLMTFSSLLVAKFNSQMQSQPTQPGMEMMKYMPYVFPFFLMFLFNSWPAALTYYYFLSNIISFGQQFAIKQFFIDEDKLMAQIEANKKKPAKKKGGFASKMEEIYKQQQLQQQKKGKNKKK